MKKNFLLLGILIAVIGFTPYGFAQEEPVETERTGAATQAALEEAARNTPKEADPQKISQVQQLTLMATSTSGSGGSQVFKSSENFQVDPTSGTATMTVPVDVLPGRKGIQPNLALIYNSHSSNGPLGVGWILELGAIQRSTKKGTPKYDSSDTLVFTGSGSQQELVSIGAGEYRPKIEGAFMKIKNDGALGWVVTDKKGIKYYFGQNSASQQNDGGRVFKWCLDRVEDLHGNYLTVTYFKDQNQIYPLYIDYTANADTGLGFHCRVEFVWEARSDKFFNYVANFIITTQKRLKEIQVKSTTGGSDIIQRKYVLNYITNSYSVRSLLDSITQYGQNGAQSLPATRFTYKSGSGYSWDGTTIGGGSFPAYFTRNDRPGATVMQDGGVRMFDLNGDGLTDIVQSEYVSGVAQRTVWLNRGGGSWDSSTVPGNSFPAYFSRDDRPGGNYCQDGGVRLVDINGDGLVDIIHSEYFNNAPYRDIWLNRGDGSWDGSAIPGSNFPTYFTRNDRPGTTAMQDGGVRLMDLNGDGLTDIVASEYVSGSPQRNVWLNKGDGTWDYSIPGTSIPVYFTRNDRPGTTAMQDGGIRIFDINADGLQDLVHSEYLNSSGPSRDIYLNKGDGSWDSTTISGEGFPAFFTRNDRPGADTMQEDGVRLMEVNGDGLIDMVHSAYISGTSQKTVWINRGDGSWNNSVIPGSSFPTYFVRNDLPGTTVNQDAGVRTFDLDADGLEDIVHSEYRDSAAQREVWLNPADIYTDLFTSMDNGVGGQTSISYAPSTQYQNTFLPFVVQTVSAVTVFDGLGHSYSAYYSYAKGYHAFKEREFRGFGWVKIIDAEDNYAETDIAQDDLYKGRIKEQRSYDTAGNLYAKSANQWSSQNLFSGVDFVYLAQTDNFVYYGDATGKRTQTKYFYEESPQYGDLTRTLELGEVALDSGSDIGTDKRTGLVEHVHNSTDWLLGLPKRTTVQDKNGNTVKKSEFYYDNHSGLDDAPVKGDLTKQVDWLNGATSPQTTFTYDEYGNLLTSTDALSRITTVAYDAGCKMFPLTTTNALGHQVISEYYGVDGVAMDDGSGYKGLFGQVKSVKDPNSQISYSTYDYLGRITATISPLDSLSYPTTVYEYDLSVTPIKVVTRQREVSGQSGTLDSYQFYDGLGRLVESKTETEDVNQQVISGITNYNSRGLPVTKYLPYLTPATPNYTPPAPPTPYIGFQYNCLGQVNRTNNPDGTYSSVYPDDWVVTNFDENGHKLVSYFDAYGRLIKKEEYTGADGRSPNYSASSYTLYAATVYTYDTLGNLIKTQDADGNLNTIAYDTLGRKVSMTDQDMGYWQYFYDAVGNLTKQIDAKNQTIQFTYDSLNRLKQKSYPGTSIASVNYTYDDVAVANSKGRLTKSVYKSNCDTSFYYDVLGRENKSVKKIDGTSYTVTRTYDAANRLKDLTYPDNVKLTYTYNNGGQIEKVANGTTNYVSNVDYTATGQIAKIVYGNGVTTTYTYDPNTLRLTHLVAKDKNNATLQDLSYSFDSKGNVLSITDNRNSASQTFSYDALDRLVGAGGTYYGSKSYAYDKIGNMTLKDGVTYSYGAGTAGPHAVTSGSDSTTFSYDANGNMTTYKKGSTTTSYTFDRENRLTKAVKAGKTQGTFDYDGDSGRTKKVGYIYTTGTAAISGGSQTALFEGSPEQKKSQLRYVFDFLSSYLDPQAEAAPVPDSMQLAAVVTPQATTTSTTIYYIGSLYEKAGTLKTKHVFLGSLRICSIPSSGSINYFHSDHLGSSNLITDSTSAKVQRLEYDPYGKLALSEGANKTDYKFTGKELDEETELYYYGDRYYFPAIGRFLTADPTIQKPFDPQDLNRYTYCRNNPVNLVDPTGLGWFKKFIQKWAGLFGFIGGVVKGVVTGDWSTVRNMGTSFVSSAILSWGNPFAIAASVLAAGFMDTPPGHQFSRFMSEDVFDDAFGMRPRAAYIVGNMAAYAIVTSAIYIAITPASYAGPDYRDPANQKGDIAKYGSAGEHQPGGSTANWIVKHGTDNAKSSWYSQGRVASDTAFNNTLGVNRLFKALNIRHAAATVNVGGRLVDSAKDVALLAPLKGQLYVSPWTGISHQAFFRTLVQSGMSGTQALGAATSQAGWSFYLTSSIYGVEGHSAAVGLINAEVNRK